MGSVILVMVPWVMAWCDKPAVCESRRPEQKHGQRAVARRSDMVPLGAEHRHDVTAGTEIPAGTGGSRAAVLCGWQIAERHNDMNCSDPVVRNRENSDCQTDLRLSASMSGRKNWPGCCGAGIGSIAIVLN